MGIGLKKINDRLPHLCAIVFLLFTSTLHAQSGPSSINISGGLFNSAGNPITSASVNFKIEIYDKTSACLLYSETHLGEDLSNTKGGFALALGKGTSISNLIDGSSPGAMTSKVYENSGAVGPWAGCASGTTLANGDERMIRIQYDLGSGYVTMNPDVPLASSAYAMVAETLQGKRPSDFLQVKDDVPTDLSQANLENIFSSTNYARLNALVSGSSTQYMVSNPSAAVGFNGQRITNVGTPSATGDAATKGYADANIGGKTADLSTVGPAAGNGHTLIWDQASQKWVTGVPSATDNSKLPLLGGTMLGAIDMGGYNLLATGHITMSPLKTITLGTFNNAQETTLISTLLPTNAGASWYNSQDKVFKVWDGTAAIAQVWSVNGKTGGAITLNANDLGLGTAALENVGTGAGEVPVLDGTGKIPSALLPTYLTWGDVLNGAGKYMDYRPNNTACGNNQVLKWDNSNSRWICGTDNDSFSGTTAGGELTGTYPNPTIAANAISTPKLFTNPGVNRLVATDSSSGATLVPFECTGTQIMQWSGTGWSCQNVSAVIGTGYIADGGNSRGAAISIGTNDNFDLGFRTNNAVKMTLDASGNLGVGTATPARLIHVNGPIRVAASTLPSSPAAGDIAVDSGSSNALKWYNGSAWQTVGTGNGNGDFLRNGTLAMTGALDMGSQNITNIGTNMTSSAALTIANTGANSLTLSSNGTNATAVNIAVAGTNGGITLAPNGTGIVTSSTPVRVTPTALPAAPAAGTIAFDSGSANAMKYYDGSAWVSIGSGTGDFLKNGSVAMTGALQMGSQNITGIGTNITSSAALTIANTGANSLTLSSNGTNATAVNIAVAGTNGGITLAPNGTGIVTSSTPLRVTPTALPGSASAGTIAFDSGSANAMKYYDGSAWVSIGSGTGDFLKNGSVAMTGALNMGSQNITSVGTNITSSAALTIANTGANSLTLSSNGTNATAVNIAVAGTNGGITLNPNGTGIVTSSTPVRVTPTALPGSASAGTIVFDSGASNALKYYDGSAWKAVNTTSATGDFMKDGSVAMTGALQMGSQNITGIGTNMTGTAAVTLASGGTGALTLTSASGVLSSTTPLKITPTALPGTPAAGMIAFDSGAANAMKYYDGSAWVSIGSGTGDFLKNGSVAMTGALNMGSQNITSVGTNITSSAALTIANTGANSLTLSSNGTNATAINLAVAGTNGGITLAPNGTGIVTSSTPVRVTPTALPGSPAAGTIAFDSGSGNAMKYFDGSAWVALGSGTGDFLKNGSIAMTGNFNAGGNSILGNTTASANLTLESTSDSTKGYVNLQPNGGNVGIGTTTPDYVMDIATASGPATIRLAGAGDGWTASSLLFLDSSYAGWQMNLRSADDNNLEFFSQTDMNNQQGTPTLSLAMDGKVGIGTATPARLLHVNGPMRITPAALPSSPAAGELAFDSGSSNALKFYDGSAWQTVGTGTGNGDFMKNGSVAMTGALNMGSQNITSVGTNITSSAALTIANTGANSLTLSSNGTNATAVNIAVAGTNGGITLAPNGIGIVTSSTPVRVTPTALPGSPAAGTIAFDSGAANAMKYYDGSAWVALGAGTGDFLKNGSIAMTGNFNAGGNSILGNTTASANLILESTSDATKGYLLLQPNGGSVGIGTSSTTAQLGVVTGVTGTAISATGGSVGVIASGTGAGVSGSSTAGNAVEGTTTNGYGIYGSASGASGIAVVGNASGSATAARFASVSGYGLLVTSGNVGIGTNAPARLLHVHGPMRITPAALPTSPAAGELAFDSGSSNALKFYDGSAWQTVGTGSGSGDFMKNGSVAMTGDFNAGGNRVLGNSTASANLELESTSNATKGYVLLQKNGGNVGVGTTAPVQTLDVNGTLRVGSSVGEGLGISEGGAVELYSLGSKNLALNYANNKNTSINFNSSGSLSLLDAGSGNITMLASGTGKVGIGTATPERLLHVNGPMRITPATLPTSPAAGELAFDSGASNALKFYDGSAWQTVGTGSGSGDFMKNGSVAMTGNFNAGGNSILGNTTASANLNLESTSNGTKGFVNIQPNGGNVGIGTSSPLSTLHIEGLGRISNGSNAFTVGGSMSSPTTDNIEFKDLVGSGGYTQLGVWGPSASTSTYFVVRQGASANRFFYGIDSGGLGRIENEAGDLAIFSGTHPGTERARFMSSGNVGIGTNNPARLLHVNGPMRITPAALPSSPAAGELAFDSTASNALKFYDGSAWQTVGTGAGSGDFMKNGSVAMTGNFNAGGNSILGNTTASANLTLESTSHGTKGYVNIQPNGGYVGIGTATPSGTLDVFSGEARAIYAHGTQTALTAANNQVTMMSGSTFSPSANVGSSWGLLSNSVFSPPTGVTITNGINIGTMGGVNGGAGTVTNAYGIFATNPGWGASSNVALYSDNAAIGYSATTPPSSGLIVAGNVGIGTNNPARLLHVNGPMRITPATLPSSPAAGELAFDSSASNALKFYDGSAWQTVGTGGGSGDFMKNGSVAMTGNFNAGGNSVLGNTTASANLKLESTSHATKGYVLLQPNGGNVGVGTTTATYPLTVESSGLQTISAKHSTTSGNILGTTLLLQVENGSGAGGTGLGTSIVFAGESSTSNGMDLGGIDAFWTDGTHASRTSALVFRTTNSGGSSSAERVRIAGNGNVGLGTNNPARPLHVNGAARLTPTTTPSTPAAGDMFFDSSASNALKFYDGSAWQTVGTGGGSGDFMKNGSVAMTGNFNAGGNSILGNTTASANLTLESTSNGTKGYVNLQPNGGNVGIGTTTPAGTLDVQGGTAAAATHSTNILITAQKAASGNSNGGKILLMPGTATGSGTAGAVGIGYTTGTFPSWAPQNSLLVNGLLYTSQNIVAQSALNFGASSVGIEGQSNSSGGQTADYLKFVTNLTERMRINGSGNVGIGTSTPSANAKLDVNGQIKSGFLSHSSLNTNWTSGNIQTTSVAAGTLTFTSGSMYDGASYVLILTSAGTFTLSTAGDVTSWKCLPACPSNQIAATNDTVLTIIKAGTTGYLSWGAGYQ